MTHSTTKPPVVITISLLQTHASNAALNDAVDALTDSALNSRPYQARRIYTDMQTEDILVTVSVDSSNATAKEDAQNIASFYNDALPGALTRRKLGILTYDAKVVER